MKHRVVLLIIFLWGASLGAYTDITYLERSEYTNVHIKSDYISTANTTHVFITKPVETVVIKAQDYPFEEEKKLFSSFRNRYLAYWLLFNVMLYLDSEGIH